MIRHLFVPGLLLVLAGSRPAQAAPLDPAFSHALCQAYLTNPQLATERQRLREVDEGVPRALSGWRPQVSLTGVGGVSAVFDSLDTRNHPERRTPQAATGSITQPLYTGGRVRGQVAQSEALVRAERAALQASEATVLLAAATAYLDVARDQAIVALNRNQSRVLEQSWRATSQAQAAGAVTETDVAQARARLADQRATTASAEGRLAVSRARFEQQVGELPGQLSIPDVRPAVPGGLPEGREAILALVETSNFDVNQARLSLAASQHGVDIARAGLLPKISLIVEGGRLKETDIQQQHQRDYDADALLQISVPIYQGGEVSAEVRQQKETVARTALQVDTVLRAVREQATAALDMLSTSHTRVSEGRISIAANVTAERGIARQQAVGARTVIEVLNAQQELLSAQVNLVGALHDEYVSGLQLLAVIGRLSAIDLDLPVPIYDPEHHYKRTRNRWYGTTPFR